MTFNPDDPLEHYKIWRIAPLISQVRELSDDNFRAFITALRGMEGVCDGCLSRDVCYCGDIPGDDA